MSLTPPNNNPVPTFDPSKVLRSYTTTQWTAKEDWYVNKVTNLSIPLSHRTTSFCIVISHFPLLYDTYSISFFTDNSYLFLFFSLKNMLLPEGFESMEIFKNRFFLDSFLLHDVLFSVRFPIPAKATLSAD